MKSCGREVEVEGTVNAKALMEGPALGKARESVWLEQSDYGAADQLGAVTGARRIDIK